MSRIHTLYSHPTNYYIEHVCTSIPHHNTCGTAHLIIRHCYYNMNYMANNNIVIVRNTSINLASKSIRHTKYAFTNNAMYIVGLVLINDCNNLQPPLPLYLFPIPNTSSKSNKLPIQNSGGLKISKPPNKLLEYKTPDTDMLNAIPKTIS